MRIWSSSWGILNFFCLLIFFFTLKCHQHCNKRKSYIKILVRGFSYYFFFFFFDVTTLSSELWLNSILLLLLGFLLLLNNVYVMMIIWWDLEKKLNEKLSLFFLFLFFLFIYFLGHTKLQVECGGESGSWWCHHCHYHQVNLMMTTMSFWEKKIVIWFYVCFWLIIIINISDIHTHTYTLFFLQKC